MRGVWGLLFNRLLYNPGPLPCADGGNPAASRRVLLNASQSMFGETSTPSANLLKRHLQPCCNLLVPQTLSRQQHNSGSFRQPYRCTPASPQSFQFLSYLNIKINPRCFPHIYIRRWTSTYISLILADYTRSLHDRRDRLGESRTDSLDFEAFSILRRIVVLCNEKSGNMDRFYRFRSRSLLSRRLLAPLTTNYCRRTF